MRQVKALVHTWLLLDFFGDSRRTGSPGSSLTTTIFGQSFLGLAMAGLLFDEHGEHALVAYATANLSLSTLLMGLSVLGDTDRLQRERADHALLRTAPLSPYAIALARAAHASFTLFGIAIGISLAPAILMFWVADGSLLAVGGYLALACALAAIAAGALSCLQAAAARWLGAGQAALLGGTLKAVLLALGFVGFALCLRHLGGTADDIPGGRAAADLWPPYWAGRLLAGHDPALNTLRLAGCGAVLYLLSIFLQRPTRRRRAGRSRRWNGLHRLERWLVGEGPLLGVTAFTATMLYRSASFRAKVLPLFGLPAAMIGLSLAGAEARGQLILIGIAMQFPAIYSPLLVAFLAHADQERGRWVFATSPPGECLGLARQATTVVLVTRVLLPLHAIGVVAMAAAGIAPLTAANLALFSLGSGAVAAALAARGLRALPFTDEGNAPPIESNALFGFAAIFGLIGGGFATVADSSVGAVIALAAGAFGLQRCLRRPVTETTAPVARTPADSGTTTEPAEPAEPADSGDGPPARTPRQAAPATDLRRERWAILALYGFLSIVPILIGTTCS